MKPQETAGGRGEAPDWAQAAAGLDSQGNAVIPGLLTGGQCRELIALYDNAATLQAHLEFGDEASDLAGRKYLDAPLPEPVQALRRMLYEQLAPIARRWSAAMGVDASYPDRLDAWLELCREAGQARPLPSLSCHHPAEYEALHQDAGSGLAFPLQVVILLSEPQRDFTGGEFVMAEQRPRMQSRPMVLALGQGDAAAIAVRHRPFQGARGSYRVSSRHGVSRVRSGRRYALDILFHAR